jgi:hypothetical protein
VTICNRVTARTSDPLDLCDSHSFQPGYDVSVELDDQGATRLAPGTPVVIRPSGSGPWLDVSCDASRYRCIAREVSFAVGERLHLVHRATRVFRHGENEPTPNLAPVASTK